MKYLHFQIEDIIFARRKSKKRKDKWVENLFKENF